jgi:hypothetical protein
MKSWGSRLARLNDMFDSYIIENYKVVEYQIKTPSMREHDLTWKHTDITKEVRPWQLTEDA